MKLVFATNNPNKLSELQDLVPEGIEILSLKDINCNEELPETNPTVEGNALQKAKYVFDNYGFNCFADDTGLEIEVLDGAPGVYSARYAGEDCKAEDNMQKVLEKLEHEDNRNAKFRTVIALIIKGEENLYEAIKIIEAYDLNFSLGNSIKYILRAGKKNDNVIEDLQKASWYIQRQIEFLEQK